MLEPKKNNNESVAKGRDSHFDDNIRIKGLQISLASYETIHSWSHGEVVNSETINYKSLKPEKGGLFCEAIFGPTRDYECYCGKYKKVRHRGKVCEVCGVEITEAIVRRERMGHIELAAPVAHIWMVKELPSPSKISLLLDISYKEVERVVYFVNYIVLELGKVGSKFFKPKQIIDLSTNENNESRNGLRRVLKYIAEKLPRDSLDWKRAQIFYSCLRENNLPFSIDDAFRFIQKHTGIRFGIGAEAILELLRKLNLSREYKTINEKLRRIENYTDVNAKKLIRRLELVKMMRESDNKPEDMILRAIPVIPPDARPIIQLEGTRFTTSDINNFYRRIIIRNERLKKVIQLKAPTIILNNEKRMLQEVVDSLFDNASRKKPIVNKDKRPLKSLTDRLKGKQGLFRQNLLGKRVDFSGRSVIVVGPELRMYEVGLPAMMVLKLFKPFIIHELIKHYENGFEIKPIAPNIKVAEQLLQRQDNIIWPIVEKVLKDRPVLLNRAPTLHRLSIQAFEPKLVDGKAIKLHPLVTTAFNADFDGDQMAVHVPLSREAVAEARSIMLASLHILGPKDGKPVVTPTQDMVLGIYYLTTEKRNAAGEGIIFNDYEEVMRAYRNKRVTLHTFVGLSTNAYPAKFKQTGILITTVGKIILNNVMPASMPFLNDANVDIDSDATLHDERFVSAGQDPRKIISKLNEASPFDKKTLSLIINRLYSDFPDDVAKVLDEIKQLGFDYSTESGTTVSIFDIPSYDKKWKYIEEADQKILDLKRQFNKGLLDDDERYQRVIKIWTDVKETVSLDIKNLINGIEFADNSIVVMAKSGARGNISNFTQLFGMRGLMSKSYNYEQKQQGSTIKDIIEIPIKHSFSEGLTVSEFFNGSFGARKGMTDTAMKTSRSGYMTRKLVDSAQEVIVMKEDCETTKGLWIEPIVETETKSVFETIADRIAHRYVMEDVINPTTHEVIVHANHIVTPELADKIMKANVNRVLVRSVLNCRVEQGVCQKCFGNDLTTNKPIEIGAAIGVIAAQSIGEPGMQLTMRTFHTGGVSGTTNITQGFERLKQLFDVIPPKEWESCVISEINGTVKAIDELADGKLKITVSNRFDSREYIINADAKCRVEVGSQVQIGSKLIEGSVELRNLLRIAGIDAVRTYLVREVQKVYRIQGIEIADKYIEIIVRQLTNKMRIQDPGDSDYFVGQIVNINHLNNTNNKLLLNGGRPAMAINQIFGLDEAPSKTGSFLSAASFQDTKKILTEAAVSSQIDQLTGLKENVIVGNLIPAGSGVKKDLNQLIKAGEDAAAQEYN